MKTQRKSFHPLTPLCIYVVTPSFPILIQYTITSLFLPLQAFPPMLCTGCCSRDIKVFSFQSRNNTSNTPAKEYRAWPGLSLLFAVLQLWTGSEGTKTPAELTSLLLLTQHTLTRAGYSLLTGGLGSDKRTAYLSPQGSRSLLDSAASVASRVELCDTPPALG